MRKRKLILKIFFWAVGIGIVGYVSLVGFLLLGPSLKSYSARTSFESVRWREHLEDGDHIKLNMVDDLLSRYQLIGMSIAQVDPLLGKPPKTVYFKDYDYVYWLGPERSFFSVDSEWLGIKFQNDLVIKVDILRD